MLDMKLLVQNSTQLNNAEAETGMLPLTQKKDNWPPGSFTVIGMLFWRTYCY